MGKASRLWLAAMLVSSLSVDAQTSGARDIFQMGRATLARGVETYDEDLISEAATSFRRALEINPNYADAYLSLAEAAFWLGNPSEATAMIETARGLRVSGTRVDMIAGRVAALDGRFDDATELFASVLAREPYNREARVHQALLELAEGPTPAVERRLRSQLQLAPTNVRLLLALVEVTALRGDQQASRAFLEEVLRLHPDSASVQLRAARYSLDSGDVERAEIHARNAITIAPGWSDAWLLLAETAERQEMVEVARSHFEQVIRIEPENHRAWYARGYLASVVGDDEIALESWQRSLSLRPDYDLARIAGEHLIHQRFDLEDSRRDPLGAHYLERGAELENRFLNRQAERAYRRGLQLDPFDADLRRALADLYLQRGYRARHLQELEVLATLTDDPDQELLDRIEGFQRTLADRPSAQWGVDQFLAPRPRTRVSIAHRQAPGVLEPGAGATISELIASELATSENVDVLTVRQALNSFAGERSRARQDGAELLALLDISYDDERVVLSLTVHDVEDGGIETSVVVGRSGVGRLDSAVRGAVDRILALVEPRGEVVERSFDLALVSLGTIDGVELDSIVSLQRPQMGEVGRGVVTAVDDLVSEIRLEPVPPDRIVEGTIAHLEASEDPETPNETEQAPSPPASQAGNVRPLADLIVQLFQIR